MSSIIYNTAMSLIQEACDVVYMTLTLYCQCKQVALNAMSLLVVYELTLTVLSSSTCDC
jgi:hypothetical protein